MVKKVALIKCLLSVPVLAGTWEPLDSSITFYIKDLITCKAFHAVEKSIITVLLFVSLLSLSSLASPKTTAKDT